MIVDDTETKEDKNTVTVYNTKEGINIRNKDGTEKEKTINPTVEGKKTETEYAAT
ncbi:hypothetical protein KKG31_02700 [Patescibacteria group bacterium]|nr:hypothetical protein [Patescibacteria group bacterium]MBU1758071.1 hypothetical protein [Patescibacteria group bacterium]